MTDTRGPSHHGKDSDMDAAALAVAGAASADAGGAPVELLGDYLAWIIDAAASGRRLRQHELAVVRVLGERAAESGVALRSAVDFYLSATWRLWPRLPSVAMAGEPGQVRAAGQAVLRAADDAVAALAEGYQVARQLAIRQEESTRREVIDDLLAGSGDLTRLGERAERLGLLLAGSHQVGVVDLSSAKTAEAAAALEREVLERFAATALVATKGDLLVVIVRSADVAAAPAAGRSSRGVEPEPGADLGAVLQDALARTPQTGRGSRAAIGRAHAGPGGVRRSYDEARDALDLAARLHLDGPLVRADDLLVYQVLLRDRAAMVDLVRTVLGPLDEARGGPAPLLETLAAYFAAGCVTTETARRIHLSVRAVTYRLDRIRQLTGYAPADPAERFTLHTAVLGAQLLDWPARPLPPWR